MIKYIITSWTKAKYYTVCSNWDIIKEIVINIRQGYNTFTEI